MGAETRYEYTSTNIDDSCKVMYDEGSAYDDNMYDSGAAKRVLNYEARRSRSDRGRRAFKTSCARRDKSENQGQACDDTVRSSNDRCGKQYTAIKISGPLGKI
jgi:uncharacterized protein YaiI (UPF0178 family)